MQKAGRKEPFFRPVPPERDLQLFEEKTREFPWPRPPPRPKKLPAAAPAPAKKSMLGKLLVLVLVLVVVAVECVVAYLCIPPASNATAAASNGAKPPADHKKGEGDAPGENEGPTSVEVDLKEYSVTIYQPASNSTLRIDFHLTGIVAADKKAKFDHLFELNQARFREQVMVTVRSTELADLTDPSLGLIKQRSWKRPRKSSASRCCRNWSLAITLRWKTKH